MKTDKVGKITNILLELRGASNDTLIDKKDWGVLATADFMEVALAQKNLLATGLAASELWQLWDKNKKNLPDQAAKLRAELAPNHIVQKILAEHDMLLCFLADLEDINEQIQKLEIASSKTSELRALAHVTHHLVSADQHREREEEIIYPELRRRGFADLLDIINKQHIEINRGSHKLNSLVWTIDKSDLNLFKYELAKFVDYLVPTMRMHIFIETNLILPIALESIKEENVWVRIKDLCDHIGYCGFNCKR